MPSKEKMPLDKLIQSADSYLNSRLRSFEKKLDLQMIDLKYGANYRDNLMDKVLREVDNL